MELKVKQFRYNSDNLSYLIYGKNKAIAIDPGAYDDILSFLKEKKIDLQFVANTHNHFDHVMGNDTILKISKSVFIDNKTLRENKAIDIEGSEITIYNTPGHTLDSLCFYIPGVLISGDTLFNGTIGNCFSGDLTSFFQSIKMLLTLPDDTIVYSGHDYVNASIAFSKIIEPDNIELDNFLKRYNYQDVKSTIAQEKKINPYLRFNEDKMIKILKEKGFSVDRENDRWKAIMSLE
ncbi:MAG: MBL fold metallo-hydrolase [Desulfobacterales bacterium]|nr:MBL fold metallo-hydrolase [Desulfobacterales bacterium]